MQKMTISYDEYDDFMSYRAFSFVIDMAGRK